MNIQSFPYRQIHLDFHTSEKIPDVGRDFDPEEFAETLERAHVNSVTCFARCHHGWMYYPSTEFPERVHPNLVRKNLLGEQIQACHDRGIRVPIYTTVQWDHYTAETHAEWLAVAPDGAPIGQKQLYEPGFYRCLCVNTPYVEFLRSHIRELLDSFPADGFFFDIVSPKDCSCHFCRSEMLDEGIDPSDPEARMSFGSRVINRFMRETTEFVLGLNANCTVFYNSGHIGPRHREVAESFTHFELESLPSGGWGYMHFPVTMRYARTLRERCLGMTGKFHTSWGDFHSFKNRAALEFECFNMLALGAQCSVGDQLHPSGKVCRHTYELIGEVYAQVAQKEPYCRGARFVADIGVLTPEQFAGPGASRTISGSLTGAVRMLQEGCHQFDVIDTLCDFTQYKLIVMPDSIVVDETLEERIREYLSDGGTVIASHRTGWDDAESRCTWSGLGLEMRGAAPFEPDFIVPRGTIGAGLPETEHVMYLRGMEVRVDHASDSEILAEAYVPYFNRTWEHFCSHRHTPSSGKQQYPAVVRTGRIIYFAHPVFEQYDRNASPWCKRLVLNAVSMLVPEPLVRVEGPSTIVCTLTEDREQNRRVLHLLHYIPERRGQEFDVIEDVIPLHNIPVSLREDRPVRRIELVPEGGAVSFRSERGRARFTVPLITGHQMLHMEEE